MNDTVITVEGLSKRYEIGHQHAKDDDLRHVIEALARAPLAWVRSRREPRRKLKKEFWALRDVSFCVKQGETVGIIGRNGAGKSTLLKLLSRITEPTTGQIRYRGRIASLLEVGTGFHPELTGRENIFLNGAILGMCRAEIQRKFDEIVAFAEIEQFLDTPVKRYSSGMYVRLAFAVAAHLESEILIVDEVLAVGDMAFQKKCLGKMENVAQVGRTVLFVSHNMSVIKSLCPRTILLAEGQVKGYGPTDQMVEQYHQATLPNNDGVNLAERRDRDGSGNVRVVSAEVRNTTDNERFLWPGASAVFLIGYRARDEKRISRMTVTIQVCDSYDVGIFACSTNAQNADLYGVPAQGRIRCKLASLPLIPGQYHVTIKLIDHRGWADYITRAATFEVIEGVQKCLPRGWGNVVVPNKWEIESATEPFDVDCVPDSRDLELHK
jgi:lipopolysaccharide transport system ATP-binding protein